MTYEMRGHVELSRRLQQLIDADPTSALRVVGESFVESTMQTFEAAIDPYGSPWQPLSVETLKRRGADAETLVDTAVMRNSLNAQVDGNTLRVGFNDPKALWHQFGTSRGLPQRMMLPWRDESAAPELPPSWLDEAITALEDLYAEP